MFAVHNQQQDPHQREERLKLVFDYCKHLTTLIVGTSVVFIAIYQAVGIRPLYAVGPLVLFAISGILTLYSMVSLIDEIVRPPAQDAATRRSWWRWVQWPIMLESATGLYISGIGLIFVFALAV